ncbi:MAG: M20 family metallopeptidase [Thermomicrobiales bacterium]
MNVRPDSSIAGRNDLDSIDEAELIGVLSDLVRIPSVFDPALARGNEREAADYICRLFDGWGIEYQRWDAAPDRPNIVADIRGGDGPVLVFEGHMDVVTPGDPGKWDLDPFGAEIVEGRMYGRGTADMKGGLVAMLFAAKTLHESGIEFPGTVRLAVLSDEEGMMQGARAFVEAGYLDDADAAIICEPEGGRVCTAQKGALRVTVWFSGAMSHGCMPDEGANPIVALGETLGDLSALEREIIAEREIHPLLGRFSISPTVVSGGVPAQGNVIPSSASMHLDVRTCPEHDHAEVVERIRQTCQAATDRVSGVTCEISVVDDRPATETDADAAIVSAAVAAHRSVFGVDPPIGGVPGSTDGTIFWMAKQLPLVTWGPGDTTIPHQVNEFVRIDEVVAYARAYVLAALGYFATVEAAR